MLNDKSAERCLAPLQVIVAVCSGYHNSDSVNPGFCPLSTKDVSTENDDRTAQALPGQALGGSRLRQLTGEISGPSASMPSKR